MSEAANSAAEEHSVLLRLTKKTSVPYGETHATFLDGVLSSPQQYASFSETWEVPRREFADPEGARLQLHHALRMIESLEVELIESQGAVHD